MDLVVLELEATAYYSGAEYYESLVISKDLYEKIKDELAPYLQGDGEDMQTIGVGELDGKHSDTQGYVTMTEFSEKEAEDTAWEDDNDGKHLYYELESICNSKGLKIDEDIEAVKKFLDNIDSKINVEFSFMVNKSKAESFRKAMLEYADSLLGK